MIDELYNRKRDFIEENIEDYQDGLTKFDMTRLNRWLSIDDDDHRITRIKTELRELLFNKKGISEENEKQLERNAIDMMHSIVSIEDAEEIERELDMIDETILLTETDIETMNVPNKKRKKRVAPRNGKHRKS